MEPHQITTPANSPVEDPAKLSPVGQKLSKLHSQLQYQQIQTKQLAYGLRHVRKMVREGRPAEEICRYIESLVDR